MIHRKYGYYRLLTYPAIIINIFVVHHLAVNRLTLGDSFHESEESRTKFSPSEAVAVTRVSATMVSTSCRPYYANDTRPFFEREPPQLNLPRRISNQSHTGLLKTLKTLRLVVLACAYNVEKDIPKFRMSVEQIINLFHSSSRILIFESDSTDKTLETLRRWPNAKVYSGGRLKPTIPSRSERIAYCRNTLLYKARFLEPDYLLTTDLDIFSGSLRAFLTNFDYETDDWSVMTGNVGGSYYDIWALRTLSDSNLNYDVWEKIWTLIRGDMKYCGESVINQVIGIHQKTMPFSHDLLEVRSAFSGAGLYKMKSTKNCNYFGENTTCEHVPFHLCIREKNQGRIFINPRFRVDFMNDE